MRISIRIFFSGPKFSIEAEPSDTIGSIKSKIQDERGIPEESQRLLYGGKPLEDGRDLRDYGIKAEATLELLVRTGGSTAAQPVFHELGPSPSDKAVEARVKEWRAVAKRGSFDDDLDIVDPDIYYRSLDILADKVAEYSEFKFCDGTYDLWDDITRDETGPRHRFQSIPDTIWTAFVNLNKGHRLSSVHAAIATSLWKTCLILSGVLSGLQQLQKANFCQSSFSLLLKRQDLEAAEIIKIPIQDVNAILRGILESLKCIQERKTNIGLVHESLCAQVFEPCISLLGRLYWPIDGPPNLPTTELILATGRITAILLDIALVSYTGSHGCRFDTDYLKKDARTFGVDPSTNLPGFRCSLRRLACLEDFLDKREVWVFEFRTKNEVWETDNKRLRILTRIEDFADIWGPVYAIPGSQSHMVRQYNVSKGIICRESGKQPIMIRGNNKEPVTRHAIKCHWHNKDSWLKGLKWKYLPPADDSCLSSDDLLLIGGIMLEKDTCCYTLDAYEQDYRGDLTNELGTSGPSWQWDTRGVSFGFSKYVGVTVSGTQKRIPDITLKEATLNKWLSNAGRRNPHILNEYHGVEVSHCSGNARRIALRTLLTLSPLRQKVDLQFPDWRKKPWGSAFWSAIWANDDSAIVSVWTRFEEDRPQMRQIVAFTLDILSTTGLEDKNFSVAFLHRGQERSIDLKIETNTWAVLLKDTRSMACLAMVSDRCLLCNVPDHSSATCSRSSCGEEAHTTLQSGLHIKSPGTTSESTRSTLSRIVGRSLRSSETTSADYWRSIDVKSAGWRFTREMSRGRGTASWVVLKPHAPLKSAFGSISSPYRLADREGTELRFPAAIGAIPELFGQSGPEVVVHIQASERSYGGMAKARTQPVTVRGADTVVEALEGAITDHRGRLLGMEGAFYDLAPFLQAAEQQRNARQTASTRDASEIMRIPIQLAQTSSWSFHRPGPIPAAAEQADSDTSPNPSGALDTNLTATEQADNNMRRDATHASREGTEQIETAFSSSAQGPPCPSSSVDTGLAANDTSGDIGMDGEMEPKVEVVLATSAAALSRQGLWNRQL